MSDKKFKFVSPGVFLNEVDNSQLPKVSDAVGPVLIGRSRRGPALKPVRVESFSDFVEVFGNPVPGGAGDDVWRDGNGLLAPTYATYAVQAYLRNSSPVNFVRLLGVEDPDALAAGKSGWKAKNNGTGSEDCFGIYVGVKTAPATASVNVVIQSPASIAANSTFTLTDSTGKSVVFRMVDGSAQSGLSGQDDGTGKNKVAIDSDAGNVQYADTADGRNAIADNIVTAVNTSVSALSLGITAVKTVAAAGSAPAIVTLTSDAAGWNGNTTFTDGIAGVEIAAIDKLTVSAALTNGNTFTLVDQNGASAEFIVDTSVTHVDGAKNGARFIVGASGAADNAARATAIKNAINGTPATFAMTAASATDDTAVVRLSFSTTLSTALDAVDNVAIAAAESKFVGGTKPVLNSSLGAVLYMHPDTDTVEPHLSGALGLNELASENTRIQGTNVAIQSEAATISTAEFNLVLSSSSGTHKRLKFSFDPASPKFIRKALNTNPVKTNTRVTDDSGQESYWLGESYEHYLLNNVLNAGTGQAVAWVAPLASGSYSHGDWQVQGGLQGAQTGWFFSQNTKATGSFDAVNMQKLFKFKSLNDGEANNRDFKVSITDIKPPPVGGVNPYGSFSVEVRRAQDTDNAPQIVERFSNCNLNPNSSKYLARLIGDVSVEWHSSENRYKHYGNYANMSRYIRVEMNGDVDQGLVSPDLVPFGVYGPPVYKSISSLQIDAPAGSLPAGFKFDSVYAQAQGWVGDPGLVTNAENSGKAEMWLSGAVSADSELRINVTHPRVRLRVSGSDGGIVDASKAYFGLQTSRNSASTRYNLGYSDLVLHKPSGQSSNAYAAPADSKVLEDSFIFTLDDIVVDGNKVYYLSGSHKAGTSYSATNGVSQLVSNKDINKFTSPLFGGYDGVDIREAEPFNNDALSQQGVTSTTSYVYASVKRALDSVSDPEAIECNLMAMPGITDPVLTTAMVRNCEARADALAVIDLPGVYKPPHESTSSTFAARLGSGVQSVVDTFSQRGINSSYGCTYYPWLKIYDETSDAQVWVPPSVIALGVFANTERKAALWFAPAGFNRGGLTEGSAGLPVIGVTERLTSKDRDKLYDANINPIATFPSEGIVVFGQKTLQASQSALDRINVRRLMIYVKKQVSRISNRILFDQNVQATWDRFTGQVTPFLERVKLGFGLTDFKVVLDRTTTTPDLIDRNILYAKIFLKPARSIEFIAIDFVITRTGASFDD